MYTSYCIEKIASSNRHEALAAAEERRDRARVPRHRAGRTAAGVTRHRHHPDPAPAPLVRRRRRWTVSSPRAVVLEPVAPRASACDDPVVAAARLIGRDEDVAILRDAVVSARGGDPPLCARHRRGGHRQEPARRARRSREPRRRARASPGHGADMTTGEIPFGVVADTLARPRAHQAAIDAATAAEREALAPLLPGSAPSRAGRAGAAPLDRSSTCSSGCARERLVVWVVEDLHWADSATRDLVGPRGADPAGGPADGGARCAPTTPSARRRPRPTLTSYVAGLARTARVRRCCRWSRLSTDEVQRQLSGPARDRSPSAEVASRDRDG